jgi:hypothetical protein
VDLGSFPIRERILAGVPAELGPDLFCRLRQLLRNRSIDLASFLRERFELVPPPEWFATLGASDVPAAPPSAVFVHDLDDEQVSNFLSHGESFPSAQHMALDDYRNNQIAFHHGLFYALDRSLGRIDFLTVSPDELRRLQDERKCFVAASLAELKERLNQHIFERSLGQRAEIEAMQAELHGLSAQYESLRRDFCHMTADLNKVKTDIHWLMPWFLPVRRVFRPIWRRLRAIFGARRSAEPTANAHNRPAA